MTIKNKYLVALIVKLFKLKPYSVNFVYSKEILDGDVTKLGFLNQVKEEFNEQVDLFNEELNEEINLASQNPQNWG